MYDLAFLFGLLSGILISLFAAVIVLGIIALIIRDYDK